MLPPVVGELRIESEKGLEGIQKAPATMRRSMAQTAEEAERGGRRLQQKGEAAGRGFGEGFSRDAQGRLHNAEGQFVAEGEKVGRGVTRGASRGVREGGSGFMSSMRSSLGGAIGMTAGFGIGAVVFSGIKMGLTAAASREQAIIGFDTLMPGGVAVAKQFYGQLQQFAAATPFELPGVVTAARQLLGVGQSAKTVLPFLQDFGDASSALGLSQEQFGNIMNATTQAMANGKIQAGDMLQITQAGLPIWSIMARALGKPVSEVRKLSEQGKLLTADVLPKLQAQMHKDYGGAMVRQSQTLAGVWSTVEDTVSMAMGNALQPLVPMLTNILPGAAAAFSNGLSTLVRWVETGIGVIGGFFSVLKNGANQGIEPGSQIQALAFNIRLLYNYAKPGIQAVVGAFGMAWSLVGSILMGILPTINALGGFLQRHAELAGLVATMILGAVAAFTAWNMALAVARGVTAAYTAVMAALDVVMDANPIMLIVLAIAALVAGLIYAYNHSEAFRSAVDAMGRATMVAFHWIMEAVSVAISFIKAHWPLIIAIMVGPIGIMVLLVITHLRQIQHFLGDVVSWFMALPSRIMGGLRALPGLLVNLFRSALMGIAFLIGYAIGTYIKMWVFLVTSTIHALHVLPGMIGHIFLEIGRTVNAAISAAVTAVIHWFILLVSRVASVLYNLPGQVASVFHLIHTTMSSLASQAVDRVVQFFSTMPGKVMGFVSSLPGKIRGAFVGAGSFLLSAGRDMVMGLIHGIQGAMGSAVDAARNAASAAVHGFKSALGIASPSKVMAKEVGRFLPPGLEMGVRDALPASVRRISGMVARAVTGGVPGSAAAGRVGQTRVAVAQGHRGASEPININVKVVLDGRVIYQTVQRETLRYARNNGTNGLSVGASL